MKEAYLLLGSNDGDRFENIVNSIVEINKQIGRVWKTSGIYQTEPWGFLEQNSFYNLALICRTYLSAQATLKMCLKIELEMGRKRAAKWGPRPIDIDIQYFGNQVIQSRELNIPHPEIQNRRFALTPLVEICPEYVHPQLGKTQTQLLSDCGDGSHVALLNKEILPKEEKYLKD